MIGRATIVCVGKLKEAYWRDACEEYRKRLTPFFRTEIIEVEEERIVQNPSDAQIQATIAMEGKRILQRIPAGDTIIALCIEGKELTSPALASKLDDLAVNGNGKVSFVIGGSHGLSQDVKGAASLALSFSPMTFPHQLARVMLLEQLYRAAQISSGGKYHK